MSAVLAIHTFDPYLEWLGISVAQRPLTPYQFLGLRPMEDDPETVRSAISRQRRALEQQRGTHRQVTWNEVKSELEQAVATLLNPRKKAEYDALLFERKSEAAAQQPSSNAAQRVTCPRCGHQESSERKFCAGCGMRLLAPCLNCGAATWQGERYCGGCGTDQARLLKSKCEQLAAHLQKADEFRGECRFEEARSVLRAMPQMHDDRFAELRARAQQLMADLEVEAEERREMARLACQEADLCFVTRDFAQAAGLLEQVPPALRDEHMQARLDEARRKTAEIAGLRAEVRETVQSGEQSGLLAKVEKLLDLAPRDEKLQALAQKLRATGRVDDDLQRDRLVQAAKTALARHQYDQAVTLLDEVAEPSRNKEFRELLSQASEWAFMSWDVRHAPYADETVTRIAERLLSMQPGDKQTAKLLETLKQRRAASSSSSAAPPRWARAPEKSRLGPPVETEHGLALASKGEALSAPAFRTRSGCFHVACGLALQGVDLAEIESNLLPTGQGKFLERLSRLVAQRPTDRAWGIDVGSTALKAVCVERDKKARTACVTACDFVEHALPLGRPEADAQRMDIVRDSLKAFVGRHELKGHRICVTLPRVSVLGRFFKLPPFLGKKKKLAEAVRYEATQQIPFPLDELAWDYHIFGATANDDSIDANQVVLVAAKLAAVKQCLEVFAESDVRVDVVQTDCLALHNYFSHAAWLESHGNPPRSEAENKPQAAEDVASEAAKKRTLGLTAVVDFGGDATNVVVTAPGVLWFRSVYFGGDECTTALARTFRLSLDKAEELKRDPLSGRRLKPWDDVMLPLREMLVLELLRPLEAFNVAHRDLPIDRVTCVGGGALLHGLLRHLRLGK